MSAGKARFAAPILLCIPVPLEEAKRRNVWGRKRRCFQRSPPRGPAQTTMGIFELYISI